MKLIKRSRALSTFSLALSILSKRDKRIIYVVVLIQIFLGLLDLVGVMSVGLIGSLAVTGISSKTPGDRVNKVLTFLQIEQSNLQFQVAVMGGLVAMILISKTLFTLMFSRKILFFLSRRSAGISSQLLKQFFSRQLTTIYRKSTQDAIYSLTSGVRSLVLGCLGGWINLISDFTLLLILACGLFIVDPRTTLLTSVIFFLTAYILNGLMHRRVRELGIQQAKLEIKSSEMIGETIRSYRELIIRNRRNFYANSIAKTRFQLADGSATLTFMQSLSKYILEISTVFVSIILAAYQFSNENASRAVAIVGIFIAASARITPAVLRVQQGFLQIKNQMGSAQPTVDLISEIGHLRPIENDPVPFTQIHPNFRGRVEIEGIKFSYDEEKYVINNITLTIEEGKFIGVVGESGAGKTTLIDLLLGVFEPNTGKVKISGLSPQDAFTKWSGAVGYVPQNVSLINGTIKQNLCIGYPEEEIADSCCWDALNQASLGEFVRDLTGGLNHQLGEGGSQLSGGQRQRLGIARAILTKPKLLILDEATSSLDGVTENEISNSLRGLKGNTTLVVIAHRLSTLLNADEIFVLDSGIITDQGSFEELRLRNESFRKQAISMGL